MTELGLVEVINFAAGEMQDMIQWWASISIGIIALTHFWEKRLNALLVVSLTVVYALFTVYAVTNVLGLGLTMNAYARELVVLRDAGELSAGGALMLNASSTTSIIATTTWALCSIGIFFGALSFLILTYRRGRKAS